jgi:hypothetical protein
MSASTIRGATLNAKNALVVVGLARVFLLPAVGHLGKIGVFPGKRTHLRHEVSFIAVVVTGSPDIV